MADRPLSSIYLYKDPKKWKYSGRFLALACPVSSVLILQTTKADVLWNLQVESIFQFNQLELFFV